MIELRLTQAQLTGLALTRIETEIDRNFGGAKFSPEGEAFDVREQTVSFDIQLTENLGDTTLVLALDGDRELRITDPNWNISAADESDDNYQVDYVELNTGDETEVVKSIVNVAGQYSVDGQVITVTLPFDALGLPVVDYDDELEMATFVVALPPTFDDDKDYTMTLNENFALKVVNLNFNIAPESQVEDKFALTLVDTSGETDAEVPLTDAHTYVDDVLSVTLAYSDISLEGETTAYIELDLGIDSFTPAVTSTSKVITLPVDSTE